MPVGLGYKAKAAFRLRSRIANVWADALSPEMWLGQHSLIPLESESVAQELKHALDETLCGLSGFDTIDQVAEMPGGSISLNGMFLGLDTLLAAALGYERIRTNSVLESPDFGQDAHYISRAPGTTGVCAAGTLVANAAYFSAYDVGNYVRITDQGAGCNAYDQVRRITGYNSTTSVNIAPNWNIGGDQWYGYGSTPPSGKPFQLARMFTHQFELARNLHAEQFGDIGAGTSNWVSAEDAAGRFLTREGSLIFDKGVYPWLFMPVMVKSLGLKLDNNGLKVTVEFVAKRLNLNPTNNPSANWLYSPIPAFVKERILFPDVTLQMQTLSYSTWSPTSIPVTSFELQIDNSLDADVQVIGSQRRIEPVRGGFRKITGSFSVPRYSSTGYGEYWWNNASEVQGLLSATGGINLADATYGPIYHALRVYLRRLRLTKDDTPISGPAPMTQKFSFQCLQPTGGNPVYTFPATPSAGMENGEIIIQTFNQNPFNHFMNQCVE